MYDTGTSSNSSANTRGITALTREDVVDGVAAARRHGLSQGSGVGGAQGAGGAAGQRGVGGVAGAGSRDAVGVRQDQCRRNDSGDGGGVLLGVMRD